MRQERGHRARVEVSARKNRSGLVLGMFVLSVVSFFLASCGRGSPDLQWLGNRAAAGETVPQGQVLSYAFPPVCTTGDPIHVLDIQPSDPESGLKVVYWAIRPDQFQLHSGGNKGPIVGDVIGGRFPVQPGQVTAPNAIVSGHCPPDLKAVPKDIVSEVIITMDRTVNKSVTTPGFNITYQSDSETKTLFMPYGMTMCRPEDVGCGS